MDMSEWAARREEWERQAARARPGIVAREVGAPVVPVVSPAEVIGSWEVRFGGTVGSDRVRWTYTFEPDGTLRRNSTGSANSESWSIKHDGTIMLKLTVPPNPIDPALIDGATSEDQFFAWKTADGRLVLTNEDTSIIELLTKVQKPGTREGAPQF